MPETKEPSPPVTSPAPVAATAAPTNAHAKALAINLDPSIYGSFAEIGAGQEVARWFLRVGAAAGTVAQTISAYDKEFSDETYGAGTRYVSRERLLAMLDHEYNLLIKRLGSSRGANTRFFVFANTVAARNFQGDNEQHGWLGVRFQSEPGSPPSTMLVHVNLRDPTALQQQEGLGMLGVNLIYATFYQRASADQFLSGSFDGLSIARLELDVIELSGPAFANVDSRPVVLAALRKGMCHAIVMDATGTIVEPSAVLRKRPLIIERGRFEPAQPLHGEMLISSKSQLANEGIALSREPTGIFETTVRPVHGKSATDDELLAKSARAVNVGSLIISNFPETYLLVEYLRRYTTEPIRLVVGAAALARLLADEYYTSLPGSLLEGLGRVLASNVKLYVQSMPKAALDQALSSSPGLVKVTADPVTADNLHFEPPVEYLYQYVRNAGWIVPLNPAR